MRRDASVDPFGDRLTAELRATGDPRILGGGERFDQYLYYGGARR